MKKQKLIASILILTLFATIILSMIGGTVKAAADFIEATETSQTSTGKTVKWKYQLDDNSNIISLICSNTTTELSGSITIPATIDDHKVKSISWDWGNDGIFENFTGLTEIKISEGITIIGEHSFEGCTGLTSITIPDSVTSIGENSFKGCTGLTSITIPDSVTSIGRDAFSGCTWLTSITIPNSVTSIESGAFIGCNRLQSVILSENLTQISRYAFCYNGITEIKIPENITTIREYAFSDCSNLTKILIPENVATIESMAFGYTNPKNLTIYGVKGTRAETYAKENSINFDTIENYDKGTGADITAPVVNSITITNVSGLYNNDTQDYRVPSNYKIKIQVEFSENLKGDKAPTLTIKIGNGEEISLTNTSLSGKNAVYEYTTTSSDLGTVKAVKLEGGNLTDEAGNAASLSVKEINGGKIYVDNSKTFTGNQEETNSDENKQNGTSVNKDNTNRETSKLLGGNGTDDTTAPGKIPQTGQSLAVIAIIAVLGGLAIVVFRVSKKYKGIK